VKSFRRQIPLAVLVLLSSSSVLLLSGCSSAFTSGGTQPLGSVEVKGLQGIVHGGQAPVGASTVQIYEVASTATNATGYGTVATPVQQGGQTVTTTTTTDGNGSWSYPTYTCANASDELYVVATAGNPGISASTNNKALALAAALGTCNNIANVGFVVVNEVTTVAMAYSLAGFMTDATHVSTSTTNTTGLSNAFATFNNLVNLNTGNALQTTPAYASTPTGATVDTFRSIVPYDTINTLADALAGCVNTDGTPAACTSLFAITGNKTSETTLDAALYIAHNPGLGSAANINTLMGLVTTTAPFQPTLLSTITGNPNDFTMTLNFTGGGLGGVNQYSRAGASNISIDGNGNIWIPNGDRESVSELSNLGAPLSPTTTLSGTTEKNSRPVALGGWGATDSGLLSSPQEVAIDLNGNAWVSDGANCLVAFNPAGSPLSGSPYTGVCKSGEGASGIAVDGNNQIWVSGGQYISAANSSGALVSGFPVASGFDALTGFLGADYLGNVWYIDQGNGHFGALTNTGSAYTSSTQADLSGPGDYAAFGANEILWIPQGNAGTLNIQPVNALISTINNIPSSILPSSESAPEGVAVDGQNWFYVANQGGGTNAGCGVTTEANLSVLKASGSLVSPGCLGYTGGSAYTALGSPAGVAVDQSGNVWVVNSNNVNPVATGQLGNGSGDSNVTEFVGLAAPVNPVFSQDAANKTYGAKP
jgi:hypothetical protein